MAQHTEGEGYLIGLLIGDGTFKTDKAVLSVWAPELRARGQWSWHRCRTVRTPSCAPSSGCRRRCRIAPTSADGNDRLANRGECRLASGSLRNLPRRWVCVPGYKTITPAMEACSSDFCRGLLRGLFDADGSVQGCAGQGRQRTTDAGRRVAACKRHNACYCASASFQRSIGIVSRGGLHAFPTARAVHANTPRRRVHELVIGGDNIARYAEYIGFEDTAKSARLKSALASYRRHAQPQSIHGDRCERRIRWP